MSVIASSDWHLAPGTADLVWATIRQLCEYAEEHGVDTLVVAGDTLEQARSLDGGLLLALASKLRAFPGNVIVVQGNHDQIVKGDWDSCPLTLLEGGNIRVPFKPVFTEVGLVVPYTSPRDWSRFVTDALRHEPDTVPRVTWAHQGFKGAFQNLMRRDRDGLSLPPGLRTLVTGHYHMPQNLGPLIYCGSPYQTSHAETGQVKSFLVFDDLTGDTPLPRRVPFDPIGPRYWTLVWDPAEDAPEKPDGWRESDITRVVYKGTRDEVKSRGRDLAKAGLANAAIVAQPVRRERTADRGPASSLLASADRYALQTFGPDPLSPNPHDVIEFAKERGLWPV